MKVLLFGIIAFRCPFACVTPRWANDGEESQLFGCAMCKAGGVHRFIQDHSKMLFITSRLDALSGWDSLIFRVGRMTIVGFVELVRSRRHLKRIRCLKNRPSRVLMHHRPMKRTSHRPNRTSHRPKRSLPKIPSGSCTWWSRPLACWVELERQLGWWVLAVLLASWPKRRRGSFLRFEAGLGWLEPGTMEVMEP